MFQMSELAFNLTFVVVVDNFPSDVQHLKKFSLLHFISVVQTWLNTIDVGMCIAASVSTSFLVWRVQSRCYRHCAGEQHVCLRTHLKSRLVVFWPCIMCISV